MKSRNKKPPNTIALTFSTVGTKLYIVLFSFLNSIFINRFLGANLRGDYTFIINSANLIQLTLNLGISFAYPHFLKNKKYDKIKVKNQFYKISEVQFAAYLILGIFLCSLVKSSIYTYVFIVAASSIFSNQLIFLAIIDNISTRNRIMIFTNTVYTLLLGVAYFCLHKSLFVVMAIVFVKNMLDGTLILFIFGGLKKDVLLTRVSLLFFKKILKFGIPVMVVSLLITCNYSIDVVILKFLNISSIQIGLYGVAATLGNMLWIIPDAFKEVVFNRASRQSTEKFVLKSIIVNFLISGIIVVLFALIGKHFLLIFYGKEFLGAFNLSLILFVGTFPMIVFKIIQPLYVVNGKQITMLVILLIAVAVNVISNFILIPILGVEGSAISSIISYTVCSLMFVAVFIKDYGRELK